MKRKILGGTTSFLDRVFIRDTSVTTKVAGLTGLVFNSAGLTCYYCRAGDSSATAVTLATATLGTWATGGFKELDSVHMPGWYEFGVPNAAIAGGSASVGIHIRGATNMEDVPIQFELDAVNYQDGVHFGLSALPNTAVTTNGSLLTSGTGTDQLSVSAGKTLLQATQAGVTIPTVTTVTNQLTAAAIATGVWQDATAGDFTAAGSIGKSLFTSGSAPGAANGLFIAGTNAATSVTTAFTSTFTGNLTGSVASVAGSVASVTGNVGGNVVGSVASVTAGVTVATNSDKAGYSLAASGLDAIPITDPGGISGQTTFPKIMVALYRRFLKKSTLTKTGTGTATLVMFANDGTTTNVSQTCTDDGTVQTVGAGT